MSVRTSRPVARGPVVKGNSRPAPPAAPPPRQTSRAWLWPAVFALALLAALIAYWPALHGQFLFDDAHMDFASPHPEKLALRQWTIGARPLVGLSYWVNYQLDGSNPFGYHLFNVFLHTIAALLVFFILRK